MHLPGRVVDRVETISVVTETALNDIYMFK